MVKGVFFDLDGTLYDRDALVRAMLEEQHAAFEAELSGVPQERFVSRTLVMDDHGYGNKGDGYRQVIEEWGLSIGLAARLTEHFWSHYDRFCELSDDTAATLRTLRDHAKLLGVITNGSTRRQRATLTALGLSTAFDVVLISESEGVRKPSPEIFRRALARCGVEAADAVFVGDHPDVDVEGARNAGLLPIWKRVPYWSPGSGAVLAVDKLSQIVPICLDEAAEAATSEP